MMSWQIVGHDWAVSLLRQSLAANRIAHAYLFAGPPQVGKTRLARALAQALNCVQPDGPCGQCLSCTRIGQDAHPDVRVIEGQGAVGSIKIEQIRDLQREAILAPYEGKYRVLILRRADRATLEAANCLLKTLEEPPAHVVLILTAIHADALPQTVVSRCQRLDLRPVPERAIVQTLQDRGLPSSQAGLVARLSGGRIGWALSACQDEAILRHRRQVLDQLVTMLSSDRVERLDFASRAGRDPVATAQQIESWATWWRDLLLLRGGGEGYLVNVDRLDELRSLADRCSVTQAWSMVKALQATAAQLEANVNARLAMEGLLLGLPHWQPARPGGAS
jgi:DNA polymerase-3 subunit delta'